MLNLLLAIAACNPQTDGAPVGARDTDADTAADTDTGIDCEASFSLTLPDGSTTTLGCTSEAALAAFEFDPDAPPQARSLAIRFSAGEVAASDCSLEFDIQGLCGPGWYAFDGAASGSVVTHDCSGVGDAVESTYTLSGGAIYLSEISGGDAPGEPGSSIDLVAVGSIAARSADGLSVTGTFAVRQPIGPIDSEGGVCLVESTDPALVDRDGDGWEGAKGTAEDCDDDDSTVFPGAYDRPDDGVDADCVDGDRTFDGVVVDPEGVTTTSVDFVAGWASGLDIALVLDTTCSMSDPLGALNVSTIAAASSGARDARWSFSTYDDYAFGSYGSERGGDLPFDLHVQITDALGAVQADIDASSTHSGYDTPESGMEALYQILTGAGYDQDCDGAYDVSTDVPPFMSTPGDPFAGTVVGSHDASISGTGDGGGVGFRDDGQPVVVLITDNQMRDPDSDSSFLSGTPGGCPDDSGSLAVAEAAIDQDAWIVGILIDGALARSQFEALAAATNRYVDSDGDGATDDAPVYLATASTLNAQIAAALEQVASVAFASTHYDQVELIVGNDPYGIVTGVYPSSFEDVAPGDPLSFLLQLVGVETDVPIQTTLVLLVFGDGRLVGQLEVDVEFTPTAG